MKDDFLIFLHLMKKNQYTSSTKAYNMRNCKNNLQ